MDPIRPIIEDNIDGARRYIDQIVDTQSLSRLLYACLLLAASHAL
jgi:hypothetical protein